VEPFGASGIWKDHDRGSRIQDNLSIHGEEAKTIHQRFNTFVPLTSEPAMRRTSGVILASLIIVISLYESAFALMAYATLYQNLNGADVVIASVLSERVDSLSTLYSFRINERLTGSISDSVISIISFIGKTTWVEDEETFAVGRKYLLLLHRGGSAFTWDPIRSQIYRQSNAYRAIRSFPESREDFNSALEATRALIPIRSLNDSSEVKKRFLIFLGSKNDFLVESAIEEVRRSKDTRSIPDLRQLSGSGSQQVRFFALTALRELSGKDEAPTYFKSLRDSSSSVRQRALQNLIWSEATIPEDTLIQIAANANEVFDNRSIAIHQLLRKHSTRSIPILESLLKEKPDNKQLRRVLPPIIDSLKTFLKR